MLFTNKKGYLTIAFLFVTIVANKRKQTINSTLKYPLKFSPHW